MCAACVLDHTSRSHVKESGARIPDALKPLIRKRLADKKKKDRAKKGDDDEDDVSDDDEDEENDEDEQSECGRSSRSYPTVSSLHFEPNLDVFDPALSSDTSRLRASTGSPPNAISNSVPTSGHEIKDVGILLANIRGMPTVAPP